MRIGIIGTGRLGICMALCLDAVGFDVTCYDITPTEKKNETNLFIFIHSKTMFQIIC
jgi:UDP-glucose 6-dehydrogenase